MEVGMEDLRNWASVYLAARARRRAELFAVTVYDLAFMAGCKILWDGGDTWNQT